MAREQMVRVLGPIDVLTSTGAAHVGGHGPRAVLGALAVGAGHAVPADHLQLVLWADHPPAASDNTLQSYVSGLRHRFGAEIILLADHSYELNLDAIDVDALVFEGLLRRAEAARDDPAERWRLCHEALSLWRGRPFGDLADDEPFTLETHRLDALRLVAMELSMEAELRLGHHEIVAAELESAVKEQPYRERLWYLLIEALALSDRRVDALRACTELRRTLAQVGIDVDDKIVALERQIINGEAVEAG